MNVPHRIVVIHTAFLGDIILTLPMVQVLKRSIPDSSITFVAIPASCAVLLNHPSINHIIEYDKKGKSRGIAGMVRLIRRLKEKNFEAAIVPHRSLRSALIPALAGIPIRIGFSTSAGKFLYTSTVEYKPDRHEIMRDLDLLRPLGIEPALELPLLYPSQEDREVVDRLMAASIESPVGPLVAIAPGSVWKTKRWPEDNFAALTMLLTNAGYGVVLIGSQEDRMLCDRVARGGKQHRVMNTAGNLTILQSAELVGRSAVLVSNDSAPMHAGVAMRTPVVAIFGATIPGFGFAPIGENNRIHQTEGLSCRPCSIHGGNECPIRTFDCMHRIKPEEVFQSVTGILQSQKMMTGHFQKRSST